mmetsp:Transcript_13573/g.26970  ORF Transcript_13573/g.26970 Transcript_13573/m.26970 type:complete len:298 (+) Transcript_13573:49-942(+)
MPSPAGIPSQGVLIFSLSIVIARLSCYVKSHRRHERRKRVKVLIFDIDDTLYPFTNGFTTHRNGSVALQYMVDIMGFKNREAAAKVRQPLFLKYHSTAKALAVAADEGLLPPNLDGSPRKFDPQSLADYWSKNAAFDMIAPDPPLRKCLNRLKSEAGLHIVAFTNAPKRYGVKVLSRLGVSDAFDDGLVFGVDDVLPFCKPERSAFEAVLSRVREAVGDNGIEFEDCVMFEDSMKNVRAAKALGMGTVLLLAKEGEHDGNNLGDRGVKDDPCVDVVLGRAREIGDKIGCLFVGEFPC